MLSPKAVKYGQRGNPPQLCKSSKADLEHETSKVCKDTPLVGDGKLYSFSHFRVAYHFPKCS